MKHKKAFLFILVFVLFIVITSVFHKQKNNNVIENNNTTISNTSSNITGTYGENDSLIPATVQSVVSENIIKVIIDNNKLIDVKMIGINILKEQQKTTIEYLNSLLKKGTKVWLQYDENTRNSIGQELCYIWLDDAVNLYSYGSCKNSMLQCILISKNMAIPFNEYPNSRYQTQFELMKSDTSSNQDSNF